MSKILYYLKEDDAISPVIGVMLILVVTVVIAATITVFATGTMVNSGQTPTAILDFSGQTTSATQLSSFDIVHKGGDELSLENMIVVIDPKGSSQYGIMVTYKATDDKKSLRVVGKENLKEKALVSAGDIIRVDTSNGYQYPPGVIIRWILSDSRTSGILAEGEFVVSTENL